MSPFDPTIDYCVAQLHRRYWSVGEAMVRSSRGLIWMVDAHKGGHRVVAKVPSQAGAWREALRLAVELEAGVRACRRPDFR